MEKKKILVAMSGGVDSSVAAAILKQAGHEVGGATIRTWASGSCASVNTRACCGISGVEDAREVADSLGIPYWVFNFEEDFKKHVVDYFAEEYKRGRTPNPCVACNEHIKFRLFLQKARQLGYDMIATGHYAQIVRDEKTGALALAEGADVRKDQSYVLFPVAPELLPFILLPISHFTKDQIRAKAAEFDLCVKNKPDSQEICFIPSNDYGAFLEKEFFKGEKHPGAIRDQEGKEIGRHDGFYHYTRGQRRGLGVAAKDRIYVTATDPERNEVIVGEKNDLLDAGLTASRMNWFIPQTPGAVFKAQVKIRSQHTKAAAEVTVQADGSVQVVFEEPQEAITAGQGAVIYEGTKILGGGWIDRALKTAPDLKGACSA